MCEPAHSIVQIPDDFDDTGMPFDMPKESRIKSLFDKIGKWPVKIGKWFHISKMGYGHNEALGVAQISQYTVPDRINYEGFWWDRTFREDTGYFEQPKASQVSTAAAREYYERVCILNIKVFRQFLERSMQTSQRFLEYVHQFRGGMLTRKGQLQFDAQIMRFDAYSYRGNSNREKIIKVTMGFTRKRNLLVPEWADEDSLWGGQPLVTGVED